MRGVLIKLQGALQCSFMMTGRFRRGKEAQVGSKLLFQPHRVSLFSLKTSFLSLQMEQLFCLGLRSRSECLKLLETCDWNLELASSQMFNDSGSTTKQRYWSVDGCWKSLTLSFLVSVRNNICCVHTTTRVFNPLTSLILFIYLFILVRSNKDFSG